MSEPPTWVSNANSHPKPHTHMSKHYMDSAGTRDTYRGMGEERETGEMKKGRGNENKEEKIPNVKGSERNMAEAGGDRVE